MFVMLYSNLPSSTFSTKIAMFPLQLAGVHLEIYFMHHLILEVKIAMAKKNKKIVVPLKVNIAMAKKE